MHDTLKHVVNEDLLDVFELGDCTLCETSPGDHNSFEHQAAQTIQKAINFKTLLLSLSRFGYEATLTNNNFLLHLVGIELLHCKNFNTYIEKYDPTRVCTCRRIIESLPLSLRMLLCLGLTTFEPVLGGALLSSSE
ncbi:hypothetical protein HELRODRAFT_160660 [Helobdella robusta]|uniref:Uncharacterized protein n=1 Tax=Helobdella robusta TaxID=6412 RepID=T1EQK5_HELRO|nr:hypothetical protein HELRODRAFT_160660 [Helobdella robusta]ESO06486.1 hypothetical protein HELRODRAFT_160660 [Helobdella robusta]